MRAFSRKTQGDKKDKKIVSRYESRGKKTEFVKEGNYMEEMERSMMHGEMKEFSHINKQYLENLKDTKSLDVKIMDLRDDPSNIKLLIQVISRIV